MNKESKQSLSRQNMIELLKVLGKYQIASMSVVLKTMRELEMVVDEEIYLILIKAMATNQDMAQIATTVKEMKACGIIPTADTYNIIIKMYFVKDKDIAKALSIGEMMDKEGIPKNARTYGALIAGCSAATDFELAINFYKTMQNDNLKWDVHAFTEVIRMLFASGDYAEAAKVFEKAKAERTVDQYICQVMLVGYHKIGQYDEFDNMVIYMQSNKLLTSLESLTALIQNYLSRNKVEETFEILNTMTSDGIYPDQVLIQTILTGCCRAGDPGQAYNFLQDLARQGRAVTMVMYRTVLDGLSKSGLAEQVYTLYDQMKGTKFVAPIYNIVLATALRSSDLEVFQRTWREFEKDGGCAPNQISYQLALEMYTKLRKITEAKTVYGEMQAKKFEISDVVVVDLISGAIQGRRYADATEIVSMLRKSTKIRNSEIEIIVAPHVSGFRDLLMRLGGGKGGSDVEEKKRNLLIVNVYKEILDDRKDHDERVLVIVMEAFRNLQNLVGVVQTWTRLEEHFPSPSPKALASLVRAASELGQEKTALAIKKMLEDKKYSLDESGYHHCLTLSAKFTDAHDIPLILIDMINKDLAIDDTWTLIRNAFKARRIREGTTISGERAYSYVYNFVEENYPDLIQFEETGSNPLF